MFPTYPELIKFNDDNIKLYDIIFYNNSVTKSNHYVQFHDVTFDPKFCVGTPTTIIIPNLFPQIFSISFELIVNLPNQYDDFFWNKFIEKLTISHNNLILWSGSSQIIRRRNIMIGNYGCDQNKFIVLYSLLMSDIIDNSDDSQSKSLPNQNIVITIETLALDGVNMTNDDIDCKIKISGGRMNEIIPKKFGIKNYHYIKQSCVYNDLDIPYIKIQFESTGLVNSVEINRNPINYILKFVAIRFNDKCILSEINHINEYPFFENGLCVNFDIRQVTWMEAVDTTANNKYEIIFFLNNEHNDKKYELELYYHTTDLYCLNDDKSIANVEYNKIKYLE